MAFINPTADPLSGFVGGAILALSSSLLLVLGGQITGLSGFMHTALLKPSTPLLGWRLWYLLGLVAGGAIIAQLPLAATAFGPSYVRPWALAMGAAFVGFGTRMGGGCTSGHGLCGLPRLSPRSFAAVCVFIAAGMLTASTVHGVVAVRSTVLSETPLSISDLLAYLPAGMRGAAAAVEIPPALVVAAAAALSVAGIAAAFRFAGQPAEAARWQLAAHAPGAVAADGLAFGCALLFAGGLAASGMASPGRHAGFLTPLDARGWDITLACVLGAGVALNLAAFHFVSRSAAVPLVALEVVGVRRALAVSGGGKVATTELHTEAVVKPLDQCLHVGPREGNNSQIDAQLLAGAALFGVGWGLTSTCPGPGLVGAGALQPFALLYLPFEVLGMAAWEAVHRAASAAATAVASEPQPQAHIVGEEVAAEQPVVAKEASPRPAAAKRR